MPYVNSTATSVVPASLTLSTNTSNLQTVYARAPKIGGAKTKTVSSSSAQPTEKSKTTAELAASGVCGIVGASSPGAVDTRFRADFQEFLGADKWTAEQRGRVKGVIETWTNREENTSTVDLNAFQVSAMKFMASHLGTNDRDSKAFEKQVRHSCGTESSGGVGRSASAYAVAGLALSAAASLLLP